MVTFNIIKTKDFRSISNLLKHIFIKYSPSIKEFVKKLKKTVINHKDNFNEKNIKDLKLISEKKNEKYFSFDRNGVFDEKEKGIKHLFIYTRLKILYHLIILIFISILFNSNCLRMNKLKESFITLKVAKQGQQKIFSEGNCYGNYLNEKPSEVWIDNKKQNVILTKYDLKPENTVKLVWENDIMQCYCLFYQCESIVEIDFSNFKTSKCDNTIGMFYGCSSLKSLNLSSFDTSSVTQMSDMFWGCSDLSTLDVSSFDTSKVTFGMGHMFADCKSLAYLNISNFKTPIVTFSHNMFNGCESLKILDFSNFDSNKADDIGNMFVNCKNLEYINLKNYKKNDKLNINFFNGVPQKFSICIEDDELINRIKNFESYEVEIKKINTEDNTCIDNCTLTNYKYEYNYKCYEKCPESTYNNNFKCINCHNVIRLIKF